MYQYESERLIFEYAAVSDAKALLPLWSDYNITKFTMVKNIKSIADCEARLERQIAWRKENALGPYVIKDNKEIIGYCGGRINQKSEAEIFYHIDSRRWGIGLGTEIVNVLITIAFTEKKINKVIAECAIDNIASWKILEKVGMKRIKTVIDAFENNEGLHDMYVYEIEKNVLTTAST
jgi:ribosomal-protein-alanine N-acetyltransferase